MPDKFTLQEEQGLDENLRPVRLNGENTSLEIANDGNGAKIKGDLELTGDLKCSIDKIVSTGSEGLEIQADSHVEFNNCGVGFDLVTPDYDATSVVVDFKTGNKQMVTFDGGNITNVQFHFPATSGNFVCLFKQDGTGSRTITNYKVYASDGLAAATNITKFAGGINPDLTDDADHVDIISIFWDSDNEVAYAVPSLDFQF